VDQLSTGDETVPTHPAKNVDISVGELPPYVGVRFLDGVKR
jgi:hypothetical protein